MKRILLKNLTAPAGDVISYRDLVEQVVRVPLNRQTGASIDEMRRGIRVLDALETAQDDILVLEDADWQVLRDKVEAFPWGMVDRRLLAFYDDVTQASEQLRQPASVNGHNTFP